MNRTSLTGRPLGVLTASIVLSLTLTLVSCHKDEEPEPDPVPPASTAYSFPITDGSYWLYQQEETDSLGNVIQAGVIDSVYVDGDTVIGANTYKRIRTIILPSPNGGWFIAEPLICVRDSAGYLVNETGAFIEHTNFTDTLKTRIEPGLFDMYYFMRHRDSVITVPAGTFTTIDYEGTVYATAPNYPHPSPRYTHEFYADQVGKVKQIAYYFSQSGYIQRRLIAYHIQ